MRFSRHAKNEMRLYGIGPLDVESAVANSMEAGLDERGNLRLTGSTVRGRAIIVVLASDAPDFVITTFPDD